MDFDLLSRSSDSLLAISCPKSQLQPQTSGTSLKVADHVVNSLPEQQTSYLKPVELGSGDFDNQHAEPSSSSSYHHTDHRQDGDENPKEVCDVIKTIKNSQGLSISTLVPNTKTIWMAVTDKSADHVRNSLPLPVNNNLSMNTFSSMQSVNATSDLNSSEFVAKGDHPCRSQSAYGKRSSGEYEVSTTEPWVADLRVCHEKTAVPSVVKTLSKCQPRADQHVTCSSADDDREPAAETSCIEKEDGEITDDEPDNSTSHRINRAPSGVSRIPPDITRTALCVNRMPSGVTSSEISSTNFRWSHPYPPPGYQGGRGWGWRGSSRGRGGPDRPVNFRGRGHRGRYWQRDPPPSPPKQSGLLEFKDRGASPDREFRGHGKSCSPDREESHVDSSSGGVSSGSRWKSKELVVGSPITSDEDDDVGGNDSNHSCSPLSKESDVERFHERSLSPVCQKEDERKDEKCRQKESRRRSSSTSSFSSSSSDSEQRRSYQAHQQGTKKKVFNSLIFIY